MLSKLRIKIYQNNFKINVIKEVAQIQKLPYNSISIKKQKLILKRLVKTMFFLQLKEKKMMEINLLLSHLKEKRH